MAYPSQAELIEANPLLAWIDENFLRPDPYAFAQLDFRLIVKTITAGFGVDPNGVYCVGSAAIGLSLNPAKIKDRELKEFDATSDLDVAIISEVHFETAWRDLRKAAEATTVELDTTLSNNLSWQKKRFFDGAIIANKLLPSLSFGHFWITAGARIAQDVAVILDRDIEVNYWIFRDYWSLRNYVASSIIRCRKGLA